MRDQQPRNRAAGCAVALGRGGNDLDRQLIARGQNDSIFLISDKAEKALEQDMHFQVWKHDIGASLFAVGAAAVLLEATGLLLSPNPSR